MNEPEAITALDTVIVAINDLEGMASKAEDRAEEIVRGLALDAQSNCPREDAEAAEYMTDVVSETIDDVRDLQASIGEIRAELERVWNDAKEVHEDLSDSDDADRVLEFVRLVHDVDRGLASMDDLRRLADEVAYYAPAEAVL